MPCMPAILLARRLARGETDRAGARLPQTSSRSTNISKRSAGPDVSVIVEEDGDDG